VGANPSGILLIRCQDQKGIVARVAGFLHDFGGNIVDSDHHTDRETGDFLMRTVFELADFQLPREDIHASFAPIAKNFEMTSELHFSDKRLRVGLMVSMYEHCLVDLLQRQRRGELTVDIPVMISNHPDCQSGL